MRRALIGFAVGAVTTVVLVLAQIIVWGLMAEHQDDDVWADQ